MKKTGKILFALGTAALVGVAAYDLIKKQSKAFYESYYKGGSEPLEVNTWLTNMPRNTYTIKNKEGLELTGHYITKPNSKFTMIMVHGYHSRALNMNQFARVIYEHCDCDLFLPDLRAHGDSQGEKVGWGYEDQFDIQAWVNFLAQKLPGRQFVLFGVSMGASSCCYLADKKMPGVKAIVEDCGFSNMYEEFNHQSKKIVHLPFAPFYPAFNSEVTKNHGYKIKEASCLDSVKNALYPMMFIHGLEDEVVPSSMAFDLYNACPTEKQLFVVKDAKHTQCITVDEEGYIETLNEFLDEHLD